MAGTVETSPILQNTSFVTKQYPKTVLATAKTVLAVAKTGLAEANTVLAAAKTLLAAV